MAWFYYEDSNPRYRKGICLRTKHLHDDPILGPVVKRYERSRTWLDSAVIVERNSKRNRVCIELWFSNEMQKIEFARKIRRTLQKEKDPSLLVHSQHKVIRVSAKENPKWICEADQGRGLVKAREK